MLAGCSALRNKPKYTFGDGHYKTYRSTQPKEKVYVQNSEDSVTIYSSLQWKSPGVIDTVASKKTVLPQELSDIPIEKKAFRRPSFDVDFLTIPFKLRPEKSGFPSQFNTTVNGAIFLGCKGDHYILSFKRNPLNLYRRRTFQYGFSTGAFTGIGRTPVNPWVTNNWISSEYDGVAWTKGIAGIVEINGLAVGAVVGWDSLLDDNKSHWLYQNKLWWGLSFGLNLN